jgi:hypothetical protein
MIDARNTLYALTAAPALPLGDLTRGNGLYALRDHRGVIRYIGISAAAAGFRNRIHDRHVTGSEERSHKFSFAYNVGRMWRAHRDDSADAKLAKAFRTHFIRRHCTASILAVAGACPLTKRELEWIEAEVKALAPLEMRSWDGVFEPEPETNELVDALIDELGLSPAQRTALDRQANAAPAGRLPSSVEA